MPPRIKDQVEYGLVLFGIVALIVGFGIGYMMYAYPQGLNPEWPIGMAMLAPALFILGGLHMVAAGVGRIGVAHVMTRGMLVCLLAVANWAAFFTTHIQCVATLSFLGVGVHRWYPSEAECRSSLGVIIGCVDAVILLLVVWFLWSQRQKRTVAPTE